MVVIISEMGKAWVELGQMVKGRIKNSVWNIFISRCFQPELQLIMPIKTLGKASCKKNERTALNDNRNV